MNPAKLSGSRDGQHADPAVGLPRRVRKVPPGLAAAGNATLGRAVESGIPAAALAAGPGNAALAGVLQRAPGPAPPDLQPAPPAAKPIAVSLSGAPVAFTINQTKVGDLLVGVEGGLGFAGRATIANETPPATKQSEWATARVAELAKSALAAATPAAGAGGGVELDLGGEKLVLELAAPGPPKSPVQVSSRFSAGGKILSFGTCSLDRASVSLDVTVTAEPATKSKTPAPAGPGPDDSAVKSFVFAGKPAVLRGGRGRTGVVTSPGAMAAIDTLPDAVKNHPFLRTPKQRRGFLQAMRGFFKSDDATLAHFAGIREVTGLRGSKTHLHENAAARLERVAAELGPGRMPESGGNGWAFRNDYTYASEQTIGDLHAVGWAIDFNATEMVHIGERSQAVDMRQYDLITVAAGRVPSMSLGGGALGTIREVGNVTMTGDDKAKKDELAKPGVKALFEKLTSEVTALSSASEKFRQLYQDQDAARKAKNQPTLEELQQRWLEAKTDADRQAVMTEVPGAVKTWTDLVDTDITKEQKAIVTDGLDPALLPAGDAVGKQIDDVQGLRAKLDRASARLAKIATPSAADLKGVDTLVAAAVAALGDPAAAVADTDPVARLNALSALAGKRVDALGRKRWIDRLTTLRSGLVGDPSFLFAAGGTARAPRLEVGNPPLTQLGKTGFFTLRESSKNPASFGADFFEAMVRHGFYPGAAFDHPDSMHFELRWAAP